MAEVCVLINHNPFHLAELKAVLPVNSFIPKTFCNAKILYRQITFFQSSKCACRKWSGVCT